MPAPKKENTIKKTEDVSKSSPAEPEILLELLAGKEGATLSRPFLPDENEIEVILDKNGDLKT